MSRRQHGRLRTGWCGWLCAAGAFFILPAYGQYPGRVDTSQQPAGTHLRATAVLEYTGDLPHPRASRLIPVAIWDGTQYQPGGLYLAQPAPLAVLSGTQYELESEGKPRGIFNISESEVLSGSWIGVGQYHAPAPPRPRVAAARQGHTYEVKDFDPDKPHFAHRPADDTKQSETASSSPAAPPVDPNRPTLHERPQPSDSGTDTSGQPKIDPGRPTFHRESEAAAPPAETASTSTAIDPNRPFLEYKAPAAQEKLDRPDALAGFPTDMKQMIGISDAYAADTESFVYTYSWSNPADAATMRSEMEKIAQQALASADLPSSAPPPAKKGHSSSRKAARPVAPALPMLTREQFHVYSLSFGGGATMVLSARTAGTPVRYVTLIAQPDFYGKPQVLLQQVTSDAMLNVNPRMKLVDAADTQGNGRADLIFELRGLTWRQFAIYRIAAGTATRVFATQPTAE